ncbi:N-acetylglucosamine 6-O-sulfotransferase [Desmophyllum pertusum]|uniref:N-acetylglucosamine 6-O-sulfotransferase n=1 Tax=Desmophyllum pertusum TaxID=174260 RepID=A0A9W9YH99_9CNID|nr:N-acetylglucosamine 6-O-sulfotransferase [Desmophyllum pertusum]
MGSAQGGSWYGNNPDCPKQCRPNKRHPKFKQIQFRSQTRETDLHPRLIQSHPKLKQIQYRSRIRKTDLHPRLIQGHPKLKQIQYQSRTRETDLHPSLNELLCLPALLNRTMQPARRRSLLIYGADRSGTTFTTKMFAEDPQLMTVYEPLWITSRWNEENSAQVKNWSRNVLDLLRGILSCKFAESDAGIRFLSFSSRQWSVAFVKNPLKSPAFCPNDTCTDFNFIPHYADTVCLTKYKHSVTKIGEPRTPGNLISSFLPMLFSENPEADVRVIQLIRDPRASLNSRIKLGWMANHQHRNFPNIVGRVCSNLAENIRFGRNLGKWQEKVFGGELQRSRWKAARNDKGYV